MDTGTQFEFNIPNLLKISLPLLIILEITKLTSYYYQFNLPIVEYLDFSEASILFLDEIITYLFFLLPAFYFAVNRPDTDKSDMVVILIVAVLITVSFINENLIFQSTKFVSMIGALALFIIVYLLRKKWLNSGSWGLAIALFCIMLFTTSVTGCSKASDVKENYLYLGTEVTLDSLTLTSDSTFFYIGRTNNYVFFYNAKIKAPVIYPSNRVRQIIIKSKKIQRGGNHPVHRPPL